MFWYLIKEDIVLRVFACVGVVEFVPVSWEI